jgi:hypothetical protein
MASGRRSGRVDTGALGVDQRTAPRAFVDETRHPRARDDDARRRQRLQKIDTLLGVQDALPVEPGVGLPRPEPGIREDPGHGRKYPQVPLVYVAKLTFVEGICPDSDAQRVEHHVATGIGMPHFWKAAIEEMLGVNSHGADYARSPRAHIMRRSFSTGIPTGVPPPWQRSITSNSSIRR